MIDLHCHLLPGIDDGARDLATALDMARKAHADGITTIACTPHIMPGVYDNTPDDIRARTLQLQAALVEAGIPLRLVTGADVHIRPDLVGALRRNVILSLHQSRFVLFEPSHHVAPPRLDEIMFEAMAQGIIPVLTHPERLTWIPAAYPLLQRLVQSGIWVQITAGSLTGRFGPAPEELALRMLRDGLVHIVATDAHSPQRRPPLLAEAVAVAATILGPEEARHLVITRPQAILDNMANSVPLPPPVKPEKRGLMRRLFSGR